MNFKGLTILVIGDVMLDHYIAGKAARISPEAPVPVVSKERSWTVPGGAANVARGLARLGCETRLLGLAAHDAAGETLRQEVAGEAIKAVLIEGKNRPTICKTRVMAEGQQLLRVDEEVIRPPSLEELTAMRLNLRDLLPGCSAVILSDYAKGALLQDKDGQNLCQAAINMARELGLPVLVDPKSADWARYAGAQCVTPNLGEFNQVCASLGAVPPVRARDYDLWAQGLRTRFGVERLLLTRGAGGMTLFDDDGKGERIRAERREVADVSGAGDTVIAVLAACVAKGLSWLESARLANTAAGIAVSKLGTAPVNLRELNAAVKVSASHPKIFSERELLERLREWRRHGLKIVFTNGCFDLLHPGHVAQLEASASFGDRLIVGLNTDASVKRIKGHSRPIQDENSRAQVLAALESVDGVILFDEDTPERLIREIRPDTLVKGGDYNIENVAGAEFVQSYGGQVRLIPLVRGHSTTSLIEMAKGESGCTT